MKRKISLLLVATIYFLLFTLSPYADEISPDKNSVFVVSNDSIVLLEGLWRVKLKDSPIYAKSVYWDNNWRHVQVPGNLLDLNPGYRGIAWYRTRLRFPPGASKKTFVIMLGKICDADEVYFNGVKIGSTGSVSDDSIHAFDRVRYYNIPGYLIHERGVNVIAVRVRGFLNDSFGMIWGRYKIGPASLMNKEIIYSYISEIFFISLYVFVGLFFLIFSRLPTFLSRQQRIFSIFSFFIAGYLLCIGQIKYMVTDTFFPFHLTQYIIALTGTVILVLMLRFLYRQTVSVMDKIMFVVIAFAAINVLVFKDIRLWTVARVILHGSILYIVIVSIKNIIQAINNSRKELTMVNLGLGIFLFSLFLEILRAYTIVPDFDYLKVGLPSMILFLSFYMAEQYSLVRQIEKRAIENLELKVQERTKELQSRNEIMETELEMARMIQAKLMPDKSPSFEGLNVYARCISMDKVGGDFYDYYKTDRGIRFIIADVSGHGVSSAFLALITKNAFSFTMARDEHDEAVLHRLNTTVFNHAVLSHFVTAAVCSVNLSEMELIYSNAGHFPIYILEKENTNLRELYVKGGPLGWHDEIQISSLREKLSSGDRIILYTDGITEAVGPEDELFGIERFKELIQKTGKESPEEAVEEIIRQVRYFADNKNQADDMTLMIIDIL